MCHVILVVCHYLWHLLQGHKIQFFKAECVAVTYFLFFFLVCLHKDAQVFWNIFPFALWQTNTTVHSSFIFKQEIICYPLCQCQTFFLCVFEVYCFYILKMAQLCLNSRNVVLIKTFVSALTKSLILFFFLLFLAILCISFLLLLVAQFTLFLLALYRCSAFSFSFLFPKYCRGERLIESESCNYHISVSVGIVYSYPLFWVYDYYCDYCCGSHQNSHSSCHHPNTYQDSDPF